MGYYMGDYMPGTRAGRMVGDPGFFSFLGGLAKKVAGFIPGVGPIASTALSAIPSGSSKLAKAGAIVKGAGRMVARHPVLTGAGAAALGGVAAGAAGAMTTRALRGGARGMGRHRRMRVTNPKALRRAIRRTQGFAKLAMRTIHLVHPRKKARFGGFRKRRRKAA